MHFRLPLENPSLLGKGTISRFLGDAQILRWETLWKNMGDLFLGWGGLTQVPSGAKGGGTKGNV